MAPLLHRAAIRRKTPYHAIIWYVCTSCTLKIMKPLSLTAHIFTMSESMWILSGTTWAWCFINSYSDRWEYRVTSVQKTALKCAKNHANWHRRYEDVSSSSGLRFFFGGGATLYIISTARSAINGFVAIIKLWWFWVGPQNVIVAKMPLPCPDSVGVIAAYGRT